MQKLIIDKDTLKKIVDAIFEKVASNMNIPISIENDYYLNIPMDEAYNIANEIKPAIGSLFDDWENLNNLIDGQQPVTFVDIDRLASILKAISQELNPPSTDIVK